MSHTQEHLYKQVRYWLETSLAPADVEEAVATLDKLVATAKADVVEKLVARLTNGLVD